jgi:predicted esterase
MTGTEPHAGTPVRAFGTPLADARAAGVLVHGRGASAAGMRPLAEALHVDGFAWLAPEAAGGTWYPHRFIAPLADNQPWLDSALGRIRAVVTDIEAAGIPAERIALAGFSQGACLAAEVAARSGRRWGALGILSGGLIGPPGTAFHYDGSLAGTPALVGCSDVDAHIPVERVRETAAALRALDAEVDERIYPGMGHTVNDDEIERLRALLVPLAA